MNGDGTGGNVYFVSEGGGAMSTSCWVDPEASMPSEEGMSTSSFSSSSSLSPNISDSILMFVSCLMSVSMGSSSSCWRRIDDMMCGSLMSIIFVSGVVAKRVFACGCLCAMRLKDLACAGCLQLGQVGRHVCVCADGGDGANGIFDRKDWVAIGPLSFNQTRKGLYPKSTWKAGTRRSLSLKCIQKPIWY